MKKRFSKKFLFVFILIIVIIIFFQKTQAPKLKIATSYASKSMISQVFIAKRPPKDVEKTDNAVNFIRWTKTTLDTVKKTATSTIFGLFSTISIYKKGLGGFLLHENFEPDKNFLIPKRLKNKKNNFPYRNRILKDTIFPEINYEKLKKITKKTFQENDKTHPKNTRAFLVVYKDRIIAEKYAAGFDKNTRLLGWSLTKSLMATVLGAMQYDKKYNFEKFLYHPLYKDSLFEVWNTAQKNKINLAAILQMKTGLSWEEDYTKVSDVTKALYDEKNIITYQLYKKMVKPAGTFFNYSTGVSNLITLFIQSHFKDTQTYLNYPYKVLIDKIGMHSALVETDIKGNFVSGSYGWATARDWARLGLLYLHKGVWNKERILDERWIDFVKKPSSDSYGAHFWTNANKTLYSNASKDIFSANGYNGQRIIIIPSKNMIIYRAGLTPARNKDENLNKMTEKLIINVLSIFKNGNETQI